MELVAIPADALRENKRVLIALPWYRAAHPLTTVALLNLFQKDCMATSISFGDAFIAHARNKLASKFLASKFDWMLMLDDDMVPPCGNAAWFNEQTKLKFPEWAAGFNTIERLISHGKTLIGATYFGRSPGAPPVFAEGISRNEDLLRTGPRNEIIPTKWIGTGCLMFHRSVFTAIEEKFPHLSREQNNGTGQWFTSSEHDLHRAVEEAILLLESGANFRVIQEVLEAGKRKSQVHSSMGMGEDVQFCVRATQAGHQPYVDLGLWNGHYGPACYPLR
jgi:hypothetical protein